MPLITLPAPPPSVVLPGAVVEVAQRRVAPMPGLGGRWRVRLGDVTRGHVRVVIEPAPGYLGPAALDVVVADGGRYAFVAEGRPYLLEVEALINYLVGGDFARLRIVPLPTDPSPPGPGTESPAAVTVEALLADLAGAPVVFVRNGVDHSPAEAVAHLRSKWAGTADGASPSAPPEAFIEAVATRSETTREPYLVRHQDGRTEAAADYLLARLAGLRVQASSRRTPSNSNGRSGP